jgi:hypothetical protein
MSASSSGFDSVASASSDLARQAKRDLAPSESLDAGALDLRVVRGPLTPSDNDSILAQYNTLAGAAIRSEEFLRWIQDSPEGPAWHAILRTKDGEIVGHTSLIPLRARCGGRSLVSAKSEYSFIREDFRASKIKGFENTGRLKNLIYIDELFKQCRAAGWNPLLISTPRGFHRVFRSIACYPVSFPLWECLLILRPWMAASRTPNLRQSQRLMLWGVGQVQQAVSAVAFALRPGDGRYQRISAGDRAFPLTAQSLSFFDDQESLSWRYPHREYVRVSTQKGGEADLICKHGTVDRYFRVCQWSLRSPEPTRGLISHLVDSAKSQGALGVRWAVYGCDEAAVATVRRLRRFGFLCTRRIRTLLINSADSQFLQPSAWNLSDAMFTFDL